MKLNHEKIDEIISLIKKRYSGWTDFSYQEFVDDEISYKQTTIKKANELLSKNKFQDLIDKEDFEEIITRIEKIGRDNNLLWLAVPMEGDLSILYQEHLDKPSFCRAFFDLLYGQGESHERLKHYVDYVTSNNLKNQWTFPTYFLFICHPDKEIFVKPRTIKWFLKFIDESIEFSSHPTPEVYLTIKEIASILKETLDDYQPKDMVDIQSLIWVCYYFEKSSVISPEKKAEFVELFKEFVDSYASTQDGEDHAALYEKSREEGKKNFDEVIMDADKGEDIIDKVLFKLLPYNDTQQNREKGAWTPIAPAIMGDLIKWFENAKFTKSDDWPHVARTILKFIRRCNEKTSQLSQACTEFAESQFSKGFQTGMLTPILNALKPEDFILINNKSRYVINFFAEKKLRQSILDYPKLNELGKNLIDEIAEEMHRFKIQGISDYDLFDMFSHWLVAIKKFDFPKIKYWKIAPGEDAWNWDACLDGNFIAIGWDKLGDISNISRSDFESRRDELVKKHDDWKKTGVDQVWKFAHIQEGDIIIANRGTTEVLGSGKVVGSYYFINGVKHGHRLPVEWEGIAPKKINEYGWRRTLIEINRGKFNEILNSPHIDESGVWIFQSNLKIYDLEGSLKELKEQSWTVTRFKDQIHVGDKVYLWESGENAGIVAVCTVLTEPKKMKSSPQEKKFYKHADDKYTEGYNKVILKHDIVLTKRILKKDIFDDPILKNLKILHSPQGTNFQVTQEQTQSIESYIKKIISNGLHVNSPYPLKDCAEKSGFNVSELKKWVKAIERKKQAILYGPPGTGKTFLAKLLAKQITGGGNGFVELVQFHPAYAYEDFIQGIRPKVNSEGQLDYPIVKGRFLNFCEDSTKCDGICVLIIDEINRANLARVFGELMYLLEYRDQEVPLASGNFLRIPDNVRIIGTMNTADRSIALVDHALRRRFAFLALYPNFDVLRRYHKDTGFDVEPLIEVLKKLNRQIDDRHYEIGISFFLCHNLTEQIEDIWRMEIEPYLEEYFFDQPSKAKNFSWEEIKKEILP